MTLEERQRAFDTIGWSASGIADRLGVNERTVRRWLSGQNDPPPDIDAWLAKVAAAINRLPAPPKPPWSA